MNKVGEKPLLYEPPVKVTDPYAIEFIHRTIWCVAPHGKILGWIRWDEPKSRGRLFHVYSHGLDEGGRRVWVKSFETIGSAAMFIRQHAAEMTKLNSPLQPDLCELVDGVPQRRSV